LKKNIVANLVVASIALICAVTLGVMVHNSALNITIKTFSSVIGALVVFNSLKLVIKHFLPELTASALPPSAYNEEKENINNHKEEEEKFDIVLDADEEKIGSFSKIESLKTETEPTATTTTNSPKNNKTNKYNEKFVQEDPLTLAKMVRESLGRDEE
jgi:hypothetical protein